VHKPNNLLEFDVKDELAWDPQIDESRIVVNAKDGRVTLSGSVSTFFEAQRAGEDATFVGGVTAVDNQLLVGLVGDAIADAEIAVECAAALDADKFVPKGAVSADVLEGWATLSGTVRHHYQRKAAEFAVRRVDGLLGMHDAITLTTDPIPSDVADQIDRAFQRNAIIDDSLIKVTNIGPTIYLDGATNSWFAKQEAENTAWAAPGVQQVVDRLDILV
jgi:osmotically-inducible protein OsmY